MTLHVECFNHVNTRHRIYVGIKVQAVTDTLNVVAVKHVELKKL